MYLLQRAGGQRYGQDRAYNRYWRCTARVSHRPVSLNTFASQKNCYSASALKLLYTVGALASLEPPSFLLLWPLLTFSTLWPRAFFRVVLINTNFGCNSGPRVCEGLHGRFFHNVAQCRCDARTVPGHAPLAHASHARGDKPGAANAAASDTVEPAILVFDMAWDEAIILISSGR